MDDNGTYIQVPVVGSKSEMVTAFGDHHTHIERSLRNLAQLVGRIFVCPRTRADCSSPGVRAVRGYGLATATGRVHGCPVRGTGSGRPGGYRNADISGERSCSHLRAQAFRDPRYRAASQGGLRAGLEPRSFSSKQLFPRSILVLKDQGARTKVVFRFELATPSTLSSNPLAITISRSKYLARTAVQLTASTQHSKSCPLRSRSTSQRCIIAASLGRAVVISKAS
jgi:hypothetical protein